MFDTALLLTAAFIAGALNAVAGGGSFLTLPALVFTGVPPVAANALSVAVFAWFALAFKHVYGGSWPATVLRTAAILTLYFAIFFACNLVLVYALLAL